VDSPRRPRPPRLASPPVSTPPPPPADTAATDTDAAAPMDAAAAGFGPAGRTQRFLTVPQVADELNVSTAQVYALLRDRSLLAIKVGGRGQWRVERDKLEDYITRAYADAAATDPTDDLPDDG